MLTASRPRTDYAEVWRLITEHKVQVLTIIGDAVARPLIDEYKAHPDRYDASSSGVDRIRWCAAVDRGS